MNFTKDINKREVASIFLLSVSLFALLFLYYKAIMPYTYGDSAFLIESVSNLANAGKVTSRLLAQNYSTQKLAVVELVIFCQKGLLATQFTVDPYNWLTTLHAYLILYLLAPVARVIGALNALSIFTALAFSSIPLIAYVYLRKMGSSIAVSILAAAICMIHPAWQISSSGQFYVDRFFIPLALLYAILLHQYFNFKNESSRKSGISIFWVLLLGVLGGLTSERNMLVVALFSLSYALFVQTPQKRRFYIIVFSIACFLYVFLYTHFFIGTADNTRVQARLFQYEEWLSALKVPGLGEYLWFNLSLLILPALVTPRLCLAVLPIVAINCIITMGGAEKNGWATHYHSHYYGLVMAAFLVAIPKVNDKLRGCAFTMMRKAFVPFLVCLTLAFLISFTHYYKNQSVFMTLWDFHVRPILLSNTRTQKEIFNSLVKQVPAAATVTATEWGMAAWYLRGNLVTIFPLGVGLSDYIMVQVEGVTPNIKLLSAVRYGAADTTMANACYVPIILENYKEVSRNGTWVLFKMKSLEGAISR